MLRKRSGKILNSAQDFVGTAPIIQCSTKWDSVHFLKQKQNKVYICVFLLSFEEWCFRIIIKNRGHGAPHLWLGPFQWCFLKEGWRSKKRSVPLCLSGKNTAVHPRLRLGPEFFWVLAHFWRRFEIDGLNTYNRRGQECLKINQILIKHWFCATLALSPAGVQPWTRQTKCPFAIAYRACTTSVFNELQFVSLIELMHFFEATFSETCWLCHCKSVC